jgi:uncharacterized protein (TIGR03067 family)
MRCFLPLLAVLCLAFAPVPFPKPAKPDPGKADLKKLQGTWAVSRRTINGADQTARSSDMTVVITGDRIRFVVGGDPRTEWTFTLDPTKQPRLLDRSKVWGKGAANAGKTGPSYRGIYRLDGDVLQFVHSTGAGALERPTDFEGKRRGETLYVLKRITAK